MVKDEFKRRMLEGLYKLCDQWFDDNALMKGIARTVIQANANKYDAVLDMLTDENGNVLVNELLNNITDDVHIDLPYLNKVLILSKTDIRNIINGSLH
jgi:hypothetical protein